MRRFALVLFLVASLQAARAQERPGQPNQEPAHVRALLVVAHPDDESEMAGTVYRITHELSGSVDQVIVSDGEGGFRYSYLAGRYYGADLDTEAVGRALLPRIRRDEARHAARVLGIQRQWFLNERDDHFTTDVDEVLQKTWRTQRVETWLVRRLRGGHYDVVFVLLPTPDAHGQHKAATILALRAIEELPEAQRPVIAAVQASPQESGSYETLAGYPITAATSAAPQFRFDRDIHFGFRDALSYQIVVDWVIAEHKSQGLFQTTVGQNRFENFWVFAANSPLARQRIDALSKEIALSLPETRSARAPR